MKNNDFDFIKNKFDNAQPELPAGLDKEILKQKILSNAEHKVIKFEPKRNYFKPIATAAACFILILGIALALNYDIINGDKAPNFMNYEELNSKTATLKQVPSSGEMGSETSGTIQYMEEQGVERPNTVKAYNGYIYYAYRNSSLAENRNKIYIFKAEKENTNLVSIMDNFISDEAEIEGLFVNENRLIVNASIKTGTITKIYDIDDKSNPVLISEFEQSGEYSESRRIGDKLYVISNYKFSPKNTNNIPSITQENETAFASSKNIAYFENAKIAQYAVISTIDVNSEKPAEDLKAVLGGSAKIHCTKEYMYINEYIEGEGWGEPEREVTAAIKLNLETGEFTYANEEEVNKYSNKTIDIGETSFSGVLYNIGENLLCIGTDLVNAREKMILFDKNLKELDRITFDDNKHISTNSDWLAVNENKSEYAVSAYFADELRRYQGIITFKTENNRIVITNEFKNDNDNATYQGKCVMIGGYVYNFDINENAPDNELFKVFSYKY